MSVRRDGQSSFDRDIVHGPSPVTGLPRFHSKVDCTWQPYHRSRIFEFGNEFNDTAEDLNLAYSWLAEYSWVVDLRIKISGKAERNTGIHLCPNGQGQVSGECFIAKDLSRISKCYDQEVYQLGSMRASSQCSLQVYTKLSSRSGRPRTAGRKRRDS